MECWAIAIEEDAVSFDCALWHQGSSQHLMQRTPSYHLHLETQISRKQLESDDISVTQGSRTDNCSEFRGVLDILSKTMVASVCVSWSQRDPSRRASRNAWVLRTHNEVPDELSHEVKLLPTPGRHLEGKCQTRHFWPQSFREARDSSKSTDLPSPPPPSSQAMQAAESHRPRHSMVLYNTWQH